jgi:hypothetical protein
MTVHENYLKEETDKRLIEMTKELKKLWGEDYYILIVANIKNIKKQIDIIQN